jgi:hypothetical protein
VLALRLVGMEEIKAIKRQRTLAIREKEKCRSVVIR